MSVNAKTVAKAIATVNPIAGQAHGKDPQDIDTRAANLLADSAYGPYIEEGDPKGWSGGIVTIYMEPHGTENDCEVPLDYYGDGFDHASEASLLLDSCFIEFINPAVASVHPI